MYVHITHHNIVYTCTTAVPVTSTVRVRPTVTSTGLIYDYQSQQKLSDRALKPGFVDNNNNNNNN